MKKTYNKPEILNIVCIAQPVMLNAYSNETVTDTEEVLSKRRHHNNNNLNGWDEEDDFEDDMSGNGVEF